MMICRDVCWNINLPPSPLYIALLPKVISLESVIVRTCSPVAEKPRFQCQGWSLSFGLNLFDYNATVGANCASAALQSRPELTSHSRDCARLTGTIAGDADEMRESARFVEQKGGLFRTVSNQPQWQFLISPPFSRANLAKSRVARFRALDAHNLAIAIFERLVLAGTVPVVSVALFRLSVLLVPRLISVLVPVFSLDEGPERWIQVKSAILTRVLWPNQTLPSSM